MSPLVEAADLFAGGGGFNRAPETTLTQYVEVTA